MMTRLLLAICALALAACADDGPPPGALSRAYACDEVEEAFMRQAAMFVPCVYPAAGCFPDEPDATWCHDEEIDDCRAAIRSATSCESLLRARDLCDCGGAP